MDHTLRISLIGRLHTIQRTCSDRAWHQAEKLGVPQSELLTLIGLVTVNIWALESVENLDDEALQVVSDNVAQTERQVQSWSADWN